MRISEANMRRIDPGDRSEVYARDDKLTGFAVRARRLKDGKVKRSFLVMYQERVDGKRQMRKAFIGDWQDPWTEAAARKEAGRLLSLRDSGEQIMSAKKKAKAERTVSALVEVFLDEHVIHLKPKSQTDYRWILDRMIRPAFGRRRVIELSRVEINAWHKREKARPYAANKALQVLNRMLGHAVEQDWIKGNPAAGIKQFQEKPREAWINETEMPLFVEELGKRDGPHAELLRFLTVTGWRISEAINLRFDQVDLKNLVAHLPDSKTGSVTRSLSPDAAILISRREHAIGHVFSGNGGQSGVGYKQVRLLLLDVCKAAGVTVISPHGLRHSAATHAALNGASLFELKEGFGWKSHQMASRYVSRAENLGRAGSQKAADAINIFGKKPAKVVEVKR